MEGSWATNEARSRHASAFQAAGPKADHMGGRALCICQPCFILQWVAAAYDCRARKHSNKAGFPRYQRWEAKVARGGREAI